jgi:hypothetical protein
MNKQRYSGPLLSLSLRTNPKGSFEMFTPIVLTIPDNDTSLTAEKHTKSQPLLPSFLHFYIIGSFFIAKQFKVK